MVSELNEDADENPGVDADADTALADRIDTLTDFFLAQRKRTGGDRASTIAHTWATILARREQGESLQDIAADLKMNYETVKTYVKLARRALRSETTGESVDSEGEPD